MNAKAARIGQRPVAPATMHKLITAARAVRANAYAPYSNFQVGAAVLDEAGEIHVGCNVENASYGLSACAERNALAAAVAAGAKRIVATAIATGSETPTPPCGMCRQVLAELGGDVLIVLVNDRVEERMTLSEIFPRPFSKDYL